MILLKEKQRNTKLELKGQDRSPSEERPVLTEKGEDDTQEETQREVNPATIRTPPHQRESGTPQSQSQVEEETQVYSMFPVATDEDWQKVEESRQMSERSLQEGREYLEEQEERIRSRANFYQRIVTCIVENEDDDKTLILGTERQEEAFRTCSAPESSAEESTAQDGSKKRQDDESMFRDGSKKRP